MRPSKIQLLVASAAIPFLVFAWRCDAAWFARHVFLPQQFFVSASPHVVVWSRATAAAMAALLLRVAIRLPRRDVALRSLVAVLFAVIAAEALLQWRLHRWLNPGLADGTDALVEWNPRYGSTLRADLDRIDIASGREIHFRTDSERRRTSGAPLDPALPTLVFTGESTVAGIGLRWEETFPAILGRRLRSQVINLASPGYRIDQSWLRLEAELPKLDHPLAVVGLFTPGLVGRSFANQAHPSARSSPGGVQLLPPESPGLLRRSGLYRLWKHLYWSDAAIDEGMASVSAVMRQMTNLARARGAPCIFVVTGATPPWMRHALFDLSGLDYVVVEVPREELLADSHPGPRANERFADALELRLRAAGYK
ncbi:MAG TPA: hypothetical protein VE620_05470 [Myxococcales bacterium]|nr:hypothetical protein [Myxococcales bacterium]